MPATLIDAHCHLTHPKLNALPTPFVHDWLKRAGDADILGFIQGGVDPDEWDAQLALSKKVSSQISSNQDPSGQHIFCVFGLHPWAIGAQAQFHSTVSKTFDRLRALLPKAVALGELGLDFSPRTQRSYDSFQKTAFETQLEIASEFNKPLVLHIVRAHAEAIKILAAKNRTFQGIVHSYSGTLEDAKAYLDLGLSLSIGTRVLFPKTEKLHEIVSQTPTDRLVIETDFPDQPPPKLHNPHETLNPPETLLAVADTVSSIKKLSKFEFLEQNNRNLKSLFGIEL